MNYEQYLVLFIVATTSWLLLAISNLIYDYHKFLEYWQKIHAVICCGLSVQTFFVVNIPLGTQAFLACVLVAFSNPVLLWWGILALLPVSIIDRFFHK